MKTLLSKRSSMSMLALSAALSVTLMASPAMAEHNESYQNVHKGWLSEYEGPATGITTATSDVYRSPMGDNETYGFIQKGWLSEYSYQPRDLSTMTAEVFRFERRLDWLGTTYWD